MFQILLDCFFPRRSLTHAEGAWITPQERAVLGRSRPVMETASQLRAEGVHWLDALWAALHYRDVPLVRTAVWRFKYRRIHAIGAELGGIVAERAPVLPDSSAVLCPVPLHWMRRFARGFNQAEILARAVGRQKGCAVRCLLRRYRSTGHQAHRDRAHRLAAMHAGVFRVVAPVPEHVILIDDVATTCATLDACARVLKESGARRVEAWVLARG